MVLSYDYLTIGMQHQLLNIIATETAQLDYTVSSKESQTDKKTSASNDFHTPAHVYCKRARTRYGELERKVLKTKNWVRKTIFYYWYCLFLLIWRYCNGIIGDHIIKSRTTSPLLNIGFSLKRVYLLLHTYQTHKLVPTYYKLHKHGTAVYNALNQLFQRKRLYLFLFIVLGLLLIIFTLLDF